MTLPFLWRLEVKMTGEEADFIKLGEDVENGTKSVLPSSE